MLPRNNYLAHKDVIMSVLTLNNLTPYFQVLVFEKNEYSRRKLGKSLFKKINSIKNKKSASIKWHQSTNTIYAIWIETIDFPTWLSTNEKINQKSSALPRDIENSLILINDSNHHLYIHTSNPKAEEIIKSIISNDWKQKKIDIKKIYRALAELELRIKSLGINNTFGAGGTAAEAKSYFGKDAKLSITPSFDAGYSFSYFLGARTDNDGDTNVFGCSAKKRKFWSTWTDGILSFSNQCAEIDQLLLSHNDGNFIPQLVYPIDVDNPATLNLISFYLDYVIPTKGLVVLIIGTQTLYDWNCHVDRQAGIFIETQDNKIELSISKIANNEIKISYADPNQTACIIIADEGANTAKKRRIDLIDYLEKEENYTLIFEEGVAFRERSFWKDNRLNTPFTKEVYSTIPWTDVDIRKEDSAPKDPQKMSIADKVEAYLLDNKDQLKILALIKDGGANEAADHVVICSDRILLIHEKFSQKSKKGLRIEDLQVVASQLIKNIRFLFPASHKPQINRFFDNAVYLDLSCRTPEKLLQLIAEALSKIEVQNECWIVQPGISERRLINRTNTKVHTLLSHLNSICTSNNTIFKLYCNT